MDNIAEHYLDPEVLRVVRSKARRLAGKYGFHRYEAEDIQQELVLDYLTRSKRFDPSRSTRHRFARLIIKRRIATLIESQMAGCRDYRLCRLSLKMPSDATNPSSPELGDAISDHDYRCRLGVGQLAAEDRLPLSIDVARLVTRLPKELACICGLLMALQSPCEVAAKARISRATLYRRIGQIRAEFAVAGLPDYLQSRNERKQVSR